MARCPFALFRGPIANMKPGGMIHPVRGLVLHVEEGTEPGTDSWFRNPQAQASAHFGIAAAGTLHQWVDTDDRAWAEAAGNAYWWSVETEGHHADPMTPQQVEALRVLYTWLMTLPDNIPAVLAESPDGRGLGWHGMGGQTWGGHLDCPGDLRRAQRADVLARIAAPPITPPPPQEDDMAVFQADDPHGGFWRCDETGAVWNFDNDGNPATPTAARMLGTLTGHPDWNAGAGKTNGAVVAFHYWPAGDGYLMVTRDGTGAFHPYHFPGDGSLR